MSGVGAGVKTDSQGCDSHTSVVCAQALQQGNAGLIVSPKLRVVRSDFSPRIP